MAGSAARLAHLNTACLTAEASWNLIPACIHYNVGLVTYKGLMGGILRGKCNRGQTDLTGTRAGDRSYWVRPLDESLFDRLEVNQKIVQLAGMCMTEYSIAWLLSRPMVASLILRSS